MVQPCGQLQRRRSCDSSGTACARRGETAGARAPGAAQALAFRFSLAGRAADRRACTGNGTAWAHREIRRDWNGATRRIFRRRPRVAARVVLLRFHTVRLSSLSWKPIGYTTRAERKERLTTAASAIISDSWRNRISLGRATCGHDDGRSSLKRSPGKGFTLG